MPTITLGRNGIDGNDWLAWIDYVNDHIDEATGLVVNVEIRSERDVQDDDYGRGEDGEALEDAIAALWDRFCSS